jgi:hypothetical protein
MAQLAAERQPEPDTHAPIELARAAVAMARRVGDAETVLFALSHAGLAMLAFGDPAERFLLEQEGLRLALAAGEKVLAQRAHLLLVGSSRERGDPAGAAAHARAYEELLELRGSRYRWMTMSLRCQNAIWEGHFDEAERCHHEAERLALEDEGGVELAVFPLGLCRAAERYDGLPKIEARLRAAFGSAQQDLGSCVGEMLITQLHARAGDRRRTEAQLAAVRAHPVFGEIKEASWLALLVEACRLLGDRQLAEQIYPVLLPRAQRMFWLGPMASYHEPPYARQLGLLAEMLGRLDDAVAHLVDAEAIVVRSGMRSHLARLRYELAGVLLARSNAGDRERAAALIAQARVLASELGQSGLLPLLDALLDGQVAASLPTETTPPSGREAAAPPFTLLREGEYWTVASGSRSLRLKDSRGLQVLAQLVASAGQELHVLQLMSSDDEAKRDAGDAGAVLDPKAVQSYRSRLLELREELEEAEGFADAGRADRARDEIDALTQELARAVGLGGRERRVGGAAERARTTVQKRLRNVIGRIEEGLPDVGKHLDLAIRTGTFCGYLPDGRTRTRAPRR